MTVPDAVDPRVLDVTRLPVRDPWLAIEVRDEVDSTNAVLVADPQPWRVLVAERQSAGRGRLARSWVTTPGQALAVSAVVPPDGMPVGWVPLVAGLAVAEAITATSGVGAALKWPNDVLLPGDGDRKVAGVLCEWTPVGVVVGVGINVTQARADLPLETATSVRAAGGEVTREVLLAAYLERLAALVAEMHSHPAAVRDRYRARCATIGAQVRVEEPQGALHGIAFAVDDEGRLVVSSGNGRRVVSAGDVIHVRRCDGAGPS